MNAVTTNGGHCNDGRRSIFESLLGRVSGGEDLSIDEMASIVGSIMQGGVRDEEIALLLTALRAKGETVNEVAGAALAMRQNMTPIRTRRENLVDTCGTGGGGTGTFNISTAAAIVAAGAGAAVAKHGNRKVTSKSGSADVLVELGVNIEAPVAVVERCLDEVGIGFCFAPLLHASMKHVAAVRRSLGVPTIFNLLGPLCNPAGAPYQLLGVGRPEIRNLLAAALTRLGTRRAVVVCGADGLGEVTLDGQTFVTEVQGDRLRETVWSPADFGLEPSGRQPLLADDPATSAKMIRSVLDGNPGPPRDIVVANAAAALWLTAENATLEACTARAAESIDSGAARDVLARLVEVSHS